MSKIFTPTNQVRLTNVSVVRLKKCGKRFEIACYKNKVTEWRSGVEKDIENVLQVRSVFANVSKGQTANAEMLESAFKTQNVDAICLEILRSGIVQVNEKERAKNLESLTRDVAYIISETSVNLVTNKPYPPATIERMMADAHVSLAQNEVPKLLARDVLQALVANGVQIRRAKMRVRIDAPIALKARILNAKLGEIAVDVDSSDSGRWLAEALIDPGTFRPLMEFLTREGKGNADLTLLCTNVI